MSVIIPIRSMDAIFTRAHHELLDKNDFIFVKYDNDESLNAIMKKWWLDEHNITIIGHWDSLQFAQEQDLTLFLLKYT